MAILVRARFAPAFGAPMSKLLTRIVSLTLIGCLLCDPTFAVVRVERNPVERRPNALAIFNREALTPHLIEAFRKPFDTLAVSANRLLPRSQPVTGWLDYLRVER